MNTLEGLEDARTRRAALVAQIEAIDAEIRDLVQAASQKGSLAGRWPKRPDSPSSASRRSSAAGDSRKPPRRGNRGDCQEHLTRRGPVRLPHSPPRRIRFVKVTNDLPYGVDHDATLAASQRRTVASDRPIWSAIA